METRSITIDEISTLIGVKPINGNLNEILNGLNFCNRESEHSSVLSFVMSEKLFPFINENKAIKAVLFTNELYQKYTTEKCRTDIISFIVDNPETSFYQLHTKLWYETNFYDHYKFKSKIGRNCNIHPSVVIESGVEIGDNVTIGPNSVVRSGSIIENNVEIGCCSVIGSEGFQATHGVHKPIKHVGKTHLCENVYVGDNATVGNALFEGETYVGKNSRIDNHVHFAHNCRCGESCTITACSLLMGSSILQDNVWLAPNAVILNQVVLHNNAFIGSMAYVNKEVFEGDVVVGIPARKIRNINDK